MDERSRRSRQHANADRHELAASPQLVRPEGVIQSSDAPCSSCRIASSGTGKGLPQTRERRDQRLLPHLALLDHHDVRSSDVSIRRLHGRLTAAVDRGPADFSELSDCR